MCEFTLKNGKQCRNRHKQGLYCWRHKKAEEQKSDDVCIDLTEEGEKRQDEECAVCYESLERETYTCTQCKHKLCMECIVMTVHKNGRKCPMCRFKISTPQRQLDAFTRKRLKSKPSPLFVSIMGQEGRAEERRAQRRRAQERRARLARIDQVRRAEDYALAVAYASAQYQLQLQRARSCVCHRSRELVPEGLYLAHRALFQGVGLYRAR